MTIRARTKYTGGTRSTAAIAIGSALLAPLQSQPRLAGKFVGGRCPAAISSSIPRPTGDILQPRQLHQALGLLGIGRGGGRVGTRLVLVGVWVMTNRFRPHVTRLERVRGGHAIVVRHAHFAGCCGHFFVIVFWFVKVARGKKCRELRAVEQDWLAICVDGLDFFACLVGMGLAGRNRRNSHGRETRGGF